MGQTVARPGILRLELGHATVDLGGRWVERADGRRERLTTKESEALAHLLARPGIDVSRDELLAEVWGQRAATVTRTVDQTVRRLRAKIERDPRHPEIILTVHGHGYRFAQPTRLREPRVVTAARTECLVLGRCVVDLGVLQVRRGSSVTQLSAQEAILLEVLAAADGRVVDTGALAERLWGARRKDDGSRVVRIVGRLRQKVEGAPSAPVHLLTVPGVGYRLVFRRSAPRRPTSAPRSPFLGREAPMERLRESLDEARLLAVVGPPGIGKTRLVDELLAANGHLEAHRVALHGVGPGDVAVAVLRALEVPLGEGSEAEHLGRALAGLDDAIVVFDEVEHLVDTLGPLLESWLQMAPRARFVTTGRKRLGLRQERVLSLGPLANDAGDRLLAHYAGRTVEEVVGLSGALGGNPLCIELAAAQLGTVPTPDAQHALTRLLRSSGGTLEAVLQRSWELLTLLERAVLVESTVFRGPFTAEAASAVGTLDRPEVPAALERLVRHSLVRAVPADGDPRFTLDEAMRSYALARLRDERAVPAVSGPDAPTALALRHAVHFAATMDVLDSHALFGRVEGAVVHHPEGADLLFALDTALEARRFDLGAPVLLRLSPLLFGLGQVKRIDAHARTLLSMGVEEGPLVGRLRFLRARALARTDLPAARDELLSVAEAAASADPLLEAAARLTFGFVCAVHGPREAAAREIDRARTIVDAVGTVMSRACVLSALACLASYRGDPRSSVEWSEKCIALYQSEAMGLEEAAERINLSCELFEVGRLVEAAHQIEAALAYLSVPALRAAALQSRARIHQAQGRLDDALHDYGEAARLHRRLAQRSEEAIALTNLGTVHFQAGRPSEARIAFRQAIDLHRATGSRRNEATASLGLGEVYLHEDDLERARPSIQEARSLFEDLDDPVGLGWTLRVQAELHVRQGDARAARAAVDRALALLERTSQGHGSRLARCVLGRVLVLEGDDEAAWAILAAIEAEHEADPAGSAGRDLEMHLRSLRAMLRG